MNLRESSHVDHTAGSTNFVPFAGLTSRILECRAQSIVLQMRVPDGPSVTSSKGPDNSQGVTAAAGVAEKVQHHDLSGSSVAGGEDEGTQRRALKRRVVAAVAEEPQKALRRTRRNGAPTTAKERISKNPPCEPGKRSSIYRGVTRHRWTGRYEAHLWDKSSWNQRQNKKGKQVYLGAYDGEEAAARAYDLAALKYWGPGSTINFPATRYADDIEEMKKVSREEYLASLRRKSSGFSRGVSKYRGVARHHHNGRWEARIGRVVGNKYLYLGTYSTQEEAAAAYDMAAVEYRGLNAVTNFDLSRYIKWLRPGQANLAPDLKELEGQKPGEQQQQQHADAQVVNEVLSTSVVEEAQAVIWAGQESELSQRAVPTAPTALGLLWHSNVFKQMLERASAQSTPDTELEGDSFGMPPMLAGMEENQGLTYEQGQSDFLFQDIAISSCFTDEHLELDSGAPFWNSLGVIMLPVRSPITV